MRLVPLGGVLGTIAFVAALGGCAHLQYGSSSSPYPTPTVTGSGSPTTSPCGASAAAGAQIIAISPLVTPTSVPTYGIIGGYGLVTGGSISQVAQVIQLLPADTVQFFNNDSAGSQVTYSAIGIPNVTAFPAPTYTFAPSSATQSTATVISSTAAWSTGLLGPQCYSQAFTIAGPGTYFFGDYQYYGLANIRNVIVSATSAPQTVRRSAH